MKRALILASFVLLSLHTMSADTIYQQPPVWAGDGTSLGNALTSHSDSTVTGNRTIDNFVIGSNVRINGASWFGIYLDVTDPNNITDGAPNTSEWSVRIYGDNGGVPTASFLGSTTLTAADVTRQTLGTSFFGSNQVTVYEFTASLNSLDLGPGTYWFSALSRATDFSPLFSWIEGVGGDGQSYQTSFVNTVVTGAVFQPGDRAFTLTGIPEPSTWLLVATSLAALGFLRRRSLLPVRM